MCFGFLRHPCLWAREHSLTSRPNEGLQGKHLQRLRPSERGEGNSVWMSRGINRSLCCSWAHDNTLRWFLEEPEMQPGDFGNGMEPRKFFKGKVGHEPERAVAGSVAFLQLGRARLQESFHASGYSRG